MLINQLVHTDYEYLLSSKLDTIDYIRKRILDSFNFTTQHVLSAIIATMSHVRIKGMLCPSLSYK